MAGLAAVAAITNATLLPRVMPRLVRSSEVGRWPIGLVAYPIGVLTVLVCFRNHLGVAAAAWGVLAFGDGAATLVGRRAARALPWNPNKTWAGLVSYWALGWVAAWLLLGWVEPGGDWRHLAVICGVAVLVSALLESLDLGLDDNLWVPPLTALLLLALLGSAGGWPTLVAMAVDRWPAAVALNVGLGLVAVRLGSVDRSGLIGGSVLGMVVYVATGWRGWFLLGCFVVAGSLATRIGYERKRSAQAGGGRRGLRNVLANGSVAAGCAMLSAAQPSETAYLVAFVAALATATGDTLASEIGQLTRGVTRSIITWRPVPSGTEGGVSSLGTAAAILGCAGLAALGAALFSWPPRLAAVVGAVALVGVFVDSLLGATLERQRLLDNEAVNLAATLTAALLALQFAAQEAARIGG